ncbi:MAG: flagellar basal-body rod protein FlgF [Thermodesulfobacteriota bacterium]
MDRGIFVALSGAKLHEKRLEVLTYNLANVNTAGFKKQKPLFEDAMPAPYGPRTYSVMKGVMTDMSQGVAEQTGRPLDVALKGDGFFSVDTPAGVRYTRDGSFAIGADGALVTKEGHPVMGEKGAIKLTSPDVTIDNAGVLKGPGGVKIDTLKLASFKNTADMRREGSYFVASPGAKEVPVDPSTAVQQGYVEVSNVNAVRAMTTMIEAQRSFEMQTKMIQALDELTKKAIDEVGRT